MKKMFIYFLIFIIIIFFLPAILTKRESKATSVAQETQEVQEEEVKQEIKNGYHYNNYGTIKLLHKKTNEIETVAIDDYLCNVVSAEMPAEYELEALKAQAIVARTYTIYKIQNNENKHGEASICDNSACCQAWISKDKRFEKWEEAKREENWNKIVSAVNDTKGKIITYEGKPINAFFHSNSGGKTETTLNVWGGSGYPYLQTVSTSGEENYTQYSSEYVCSKQEFISKIQEKHKDFAIDFSNPEELKVLEHTDGNRIKKMKVGNLELSGVELRTIFSLRSANFTVQLDGENIKFQVTGYGHGVGMSQTGADSMAKQGSDYEEIIRHFYTGIEIINL